MPASSTRVSRATVLGVAALAATLALPAAGAQTIAITGGKVYAPSGPPIDNGTVLIRDGKIVAVGANVAVPAGAERIDATGKVVTPGLIDMGTQIGLVEVSGVPDTRQASARSTDEDQVHAALTVWLGMNPASVLIAPARDEGVTTVGIWPQGGLVSGQGAAIQLVDGSVSDMVLRAPIGMIAQVDDPRSAGAGAKGELLGKLRELLDDARYYAANRSAFNQGSSRDLSASRLDLEALQPVLQRRLPLVVTADKASDIEAALDLAREYRVRLVIAGASEGWMVADKLAAAKVPVMVGAMNNIPGSFSTLGSRQENAGLLRKAGVEVILMSTGSNGESFNVRNIKQDAGNAVAYGMSWHDALRAVTIVPAEVFGIADRVGSLSAGRDADVVVWSGDPFEFSTRAEHVIVRGKRQTLGESRQDMLMQRYRTLPPDYSTP
jgi:imidazolonepropionase-like amidohydrolase